MYKYFSMLMLLTYFNTRTQPKIEIPEILVKGGAFEMGCTIEQEIDCQENEFPVRQVRVEDFYMNIYEVTQQIWQQIMGNWPSKYKGCKSCPVESVSWFNAQKFIQALNKKSGKNYRLPTEAEWEYAARGGQKAQNNKFAGSKDVKAVCWYDDNSNNRPHPVGRKAPNELGLYDMSGNVWEWCSNVYGDNAAVRGGAWNSYFWNTRISVRDISVRKKTYVNIGLRLARSKNQ